MTSRVTFGMLALVIALVGCSAEPTPTPAPACPTAAPSATEAQAILEDAATATVTVSGAVSGEFSFELLGDAAPIATANFVALARCGFYEGIWFHRVLSGFVIQAGDPQTKGQTGDFPGVGRGGAGYEYEIEQPAEGLDYAPYTVAMANDGQTNDSQFFITLVDLAGRLALDYTIFGRVTEGTDVIDSIAAVPVNDPQVGVPLSLVTIDSVTISGGEEPVPSG
jgi:cyclophilin family peptidyl-prolyl cis-trans isomerase